MKIEAIMERKADDISLDMLSRLLVDVQKDSSQIIGDLLSAYQRSLLEMIFSGDEMNRSVSVLYSCPCWSYRISPPNRRCEHTRSP